MNISYVTAALAPTLGQISLDEIVDVAVHDGLHIAGLVGCAVILDQFVGMEDVGANLASKIDALLRALYRFEPLVLLVFEVLVHPGGEHFQSHRFILELRALVLALHGNTGRQVSETHR